MDFSKTTVVPPPEVKLTITLSNVECVKLFRQIEDMAGEVNEDYPYELATFASALHAYFTRGYVREA